MTNPTQFPTPLAPGGLMTGKGVSGLRSPPQTDWRQPDLKGAPIVGTISGLDSAGVASQGSEADQSQGLVILGAGASPAASGVLTLVFPAAISRPYFVAADWAALAQSVDGSTLSIAWVSTRTIRPFERLVLAYQWEVSQ